MSWHPDDILSILDKCCEKFTFPMLDNGYVYLAATRLSLFRSPQDWAIVIEVFGFSPRAGIPDLHLYTFASKLLRKKSALDYVTPQAYETHLANNEYNESTFIFPIEGGDWLDSENQEYLASGQHTVLVRGNAVQTPALPEYAAHDITLQGPVVGVFEFCRLLAATARNDVLATAEERRACIPLELEQLMQLEEWHHPNLINGERPSTNPTFRSLAELLVSGNVSGYRPLEYPNTHWKNWPEGGTL